MTAGAAAAGAGIGGLWAIYRYRRQAPDMPRVNVTVTATLIPKPDADYMSINVELRHLAGGTLLIDPPGNPTVRIIRLAHVDGKAAALDATEIETVAVLAGQDEVGSSEIIADSELVLLGARQPGTVGYKATLQVQARWGDRAWDWPANALVLTDGPSSASGSVVVGAPTPS